MPRGPRGEKRPADVIGNAVKVMRIATGEEPRNWKPTVPKALLQSRRQVRAARLCPERRSEVARTAARMRWAKP